MQHVERAIFDLRRGLPVVVDGAHTRHLVAPIEATTAELIEDMKNGARSAPQLVLTAHRMAHMGRHEALKPAAIVLQAADTREDVVRWAVDPEAGWPAGRPTIDASDVGEAALTLLRRGLLIPAAIVVEPDDNLGQAIQRRLDRGDLLSVSAADVFAHRQAAPSLLRRVSEADVPLEAAPDSRFVIFREADGIREHVAIVIGDPARWANPIPVRLHSACLTGDLFGSLRCDCGPQLKASLTTISERGGGVLLYLAQEGRGIGLANKMRAYQMQDDGFDTVDADRVLGFDRDERDYAVAREMLAQLDVAHIELLTNNPAKLEAMNREPIEVASRRGIYGRLTRQNQRYLTTKAERAGHWLDALLSEPVPSESGSRGRNEQA